MNEADFCKTNVEGATMARRYDLQYGFMPADRKAVPYDESSAPPQPGQLSEPDPAPLSSSPGSSDVPSPADSLSKDPNFSGTSPPSSDTVDPKPVPIMQEDLNEIVRVLNLPKLKSELLASWLKGFHVLGSNARVTAFRSRNEIFTEFFADDPDDDFCFCADIDGLFAALKYKHVPEEWRLFVDSSVKSLKAVLLHNGNLLPSVPIAYSTAMKEEYRSLAKILNRVQYEKYGWQIVADLKVVAILQGMQLGYTKHSCYLCYWDNRRKDVNHYDMKDWEPRNIAVIGEHNNEPLVPRERILLPPLHIKLRLFTSFVKSFRLDSEPLNFLRDMFTKLSQMKVQAGVFVGPQIRRLITHDDGFIRTLSDEQFIAWSAFKAMCESVLGTR